MKISLWPHGRGALSPLIGLPLPHHIQKEENNDMNQKKEIALQKTKKTTRVELQKERTTNEKKQYEKERIRSKQVE